MGFCNAQIPILVPPGNGSEQLKNILQISFFGFVIIICVLYPPK